MKHQNIDRVWIEKAARINSGENTTYYVLYKSGLIRTYCNTAKCDLPGTIKEFIKSSYIMTSIDGSRIYTINNL